MKCSDIHKKLIPYLNGELSKREAESVDAHLNSCESCYGLYSDMQKTFGLADRRKELEPDPFLYTRIAQRLEDAEIAGSKQENRSIAKRVLQPVLVAVMLFVAVFSGVKLGNAFEVKPGHKVVVEKTTAYYLDDLQQERLEMTILKEQ